MGGVGGGAAQQPGLKGHWGPAVMQQVPCAGRGTEPFLERAGLGRARVPGCPSSLGS